MNETGIEWATHTANWLAGCKKVSPACQNCYAETMTARLATMPNAPRRYREGVIEGRRWTGRVAYSPAALFRAFDELERAAKPRRVFVNSMSDTFHAEAPPQSLHDLAERIKVWDQCWWRSDTGCERLDAVGEEISTMEMPTRGRRSCIMLLTKRPDRLLAWQREHFPDGLPSWVWVGCTVEDQRRADERVPELLQVNAAVRFLSCEPLLGPVDLHNLDAAGIGLPGYFSALLPTAISPALSWVIAGGESGPGARPMHPAWARLLREQCVETSVPFLFKQWGEWRPGPSGPLGSPGHGTDLSVERGDEGMSLPFFNRIRHYGSTVAPMFRPGKRLAGRHLDGVIHDGFPTEVSDG